MVNLDAFDILDSTPVKVGREDRTNWHSVRAVHGSRTAKLWGKSDPFVKLLCVLKMEEECRACSAGMPLTLI